MTVSRADELAHHQEKVLANRYVRSVVQRFAEAIVEEQFPNRETIEQGLDSARQLVAELVAVDADFPPPSQLEIWTQFEVSSVVSQDEYWLDNLAAAELINSYYPSWWQDQWVKDLVIATLLVSRLLKADCLFHYPLAERAFGVKICILQIVLPSGKILSGPRVSLQKDA